MMNLPRQTWFRPALRGIMLGAAVTAMLAAKPSPTPVSAAPDIASTADLQPASPASLDALEGWKQAQMGKPLNAAKSCCAKDEPAVEKSCCDKEPATPAPAPQPRP